MRQALQLSYTPPLFDLLTPVDKNTYPVPQPVVTKLRDNHLNYIITWFVFIRLRWLSDFG